MLKAILVSLFPLLLLLRYTCSRALRLSVPLANDIISYLWRFRNTCYFLRLPSALSSGPHLRRICLRTNMNVQERRWITAVLECTCEHVVFHFPSIEQAISHTLRLCPSRESRRSSDAPTLSPLSSPHWRQLLTCALSPKSISWCNRTEFFCHCFEESARDEY